MKAIIGKLLLAVGLVIGMAGMSGCVIHAHSGTEHAKPVNKPKPAKKIKAKPPTSPVQKPDEKPTEETSTGGPAASEQADPPPPPAPSF